MNTISLIQENNLSLKQNQQLLINLAMKQAFHVLQLPILELSEWLKTEIESNPVLEVDLTKESFKESLDIPSKMRSRENLDRSRKEQQENFLKTSVSLYEHLMQQAQLVLEERQDLSVAELIIGHLDEKGLLETPLQEIAPHIPLETLKRILKTIQSFDPPGIAASNLQESLLIQLKMKEHPDALAIKIIAEHFDDLIQNRLPHLSKQLGISISALTQIINTQIAPLDVHPGYRFTPQPTAAIIPDLMLLCIEGKWFVEINTAFLPRFHIAPIYVEAIRDHSLGDSENTYLRRQIASGTWLQRAVQKRNHTLRRIGDLLLKKHAPFFNAEKGSLTPLTLEEAAKELGMHTSTISRAVANKFLFCPQGLFPIKSFFSQGLSTCSGQKISNHSLRKILRRTIDTEDKRRPLSDSALAAHFGKLGISCARRTIAKYRSSLKISPASKRKKWM